MLSALQPAILLRDGVTALTSNFGRLCRVNDFTVALVSRLLAEGRGRSARTGQCDRCTP